MGYWCIALILVVLLAAVVQLMLHLRRTHHDARPKWYIRAMFYCRGGAKRCVEEVQIAPQCNLVCVNKKAFGHGVMSSGHSTISWPHPALKWYGQRVHTMNELIVSFQRWEGSVGDDTNFFWWTTKTVAGSYMRVTMGDLLVWGQKYWTQNSTTIPLESRRQGL